MYTHTTVCLFMAIVGGQFKLLLMPIQQKAAAAVAYIKK